MARVVPGAGSAVEAAVEGQAVAARAVVAVVAAATAAVAAVAMTRGAAGADRQAVGVAAELRWGRAAAAMGVAS